MNTSNPALHPSPALNVVQVLRHHSLLLLVVSLHYCLALYVQTKAPVKLQPPAAWVGSLILGLVFALCGYTIFVMAVRRPARLVHYLATSLRAYITAQRLAFALPVIVMVPLFASSFTLVKGAIPLINPFEWDVSFSALDAQLHGGTHPWAWLQPVLGYPPVTAAINFVYHLWFFFLIGSVYWLAFSMERARLRMQYLLSFVLTWIVLGNFAALWLSSAGPCYFGRVTGLADPYAPLMQYLHSARDTVPVWALNVQELLWQSYSGKPGTMPLGISAMPSLHVASSVQLAMLGWRLDRRLGIAMTVFALLILIGSVHLGWHYAIDGYLGAIGGFLVWKLVERIPGLGARRNGGQS